jgi:hypothetical protein
MIPVPPGCDQEFAPCAVQFQVRGRSAPCSACRSFNATPGSLLITRPKLLLVFASASLRTHRAAISKVNLRRDAQHLVLGKLSFRLGMFASFWLLLFVPGDCCSDSLFNPAVLMEHRLAEPRSPRWPATEPTKPQRPLGTSLAPIFPCVV